MSLANPIPSDVKRDLILPSDLVSGEPTHGKNQPEDSPPSATTHCEALEESARQHTRFQIHQPKPNHDLSPNIGRC